MQAGGLTTQDAYRVSGRVIINGQDVGASVQSLNFDREAPSGLPGGGGFRSASGTVTATVGDDVAVRPLAPWGRRGNWPPKPMDRVEIILSDGRREWTQFVGTVKDPSGSATSRTVTFTVQDNYQPLNGLVSVPALSESMPSLQDANNYRYINLHTVFLADMVLRQVGRYATPSRVQGDVVGATMIGSTWPQRGTILESLKAAADGGSVAFPNWVNTRYGLAVQNVSAEYEPNIWSGTPGDGRMHNRPVEITQEVLPDSGEPTYLRARFWGGGRVALVQYDTAIRLSYYSPDGSITTLLQASNSDRVRATAQFSMTGTTLTAELRTQSSDGTINHEGTATLDVGADLNGQIDHVWAHGEGAQGAFQVAFPPAGREWEALDFTPNVVFHVARAGRNHLIGFPAQVNVPAIDLLNDQSDAEFAQWWIDEHDVLQWWERGLLAQQSPVATLTGRDHIVDMPWSYNFDASRSTVSVKYKETSVTQRWRTNLTLWQGGNDTLQEGDEDETFVNVPNDEIWLGVHHEQPYVYNVDNSTFWPRRGIGTVVGGIAVDDDGNERRTNSIGVQLRKITDNTYVFNTWVTVIGTDEQAVLQFASERETDVSLWARWYGENLPLLRGKKKIELLDETITSEIRGPAMAPTYTHDAGYWIQNTAYAGQTADYAAASLTDPSPRIEQAEIMPVFNLQVGDVITLADPEVTGLRIIGLVTGNSISADLANGSATQRISLTPQSISFDQATWADFGEVYGGTTWETWAQATSNETWADFGANPLN